MPCPSEFRSRAVGNGYAVIPLNGKIPVLAGWQKRTDTTLDELKLWERTAPAARNTGFLTQRTPALDIDVLDPEAAAAVESMVRARFEARGFFLVRHGRHPKRAIPFRTDTPFPKIVVSFEVADGAPGEKLELLCDGQQLAADGDHPDTGKPYRWFGGSPADVAREDLPVINEDEARALIADIERMLVEKFGYRTTSPKAGKKKGNGADATAGPTDWRLNPEALIDHDRLVSLAASLTKAGMNPAAVQNFLRQNIEDLTGVEEERRQRRLTEIPGIVASAAGKVEQAPPPSDNQAPISFTPTPYVWRDPATIQPRQFLYGRHYIRGYLSATVAPGGVGKSSLDLVEMIAMASGRNLLGITPPKRLKCWYVNLEDTREEIERRTAAICVHFNIKREDLEGHLFFDGRETELVLATQTKSGAVIATPVVDALDKAVTEGKFDVFALDPFVSAHRVSENDNMAIDSVVKALGKIGGAAACAVEIVHHVRKTGGAEITAEDARGASAITAAARKVRVLNRMSQEEAKQCGISEDRGYYFRADGAGVAKANLAPPSTKAEWFRLANVALGNATEDYPLGDQVGVVTTWQWPDAFAGVTADDIPKVKDAVANGKWRKDVRAKNWVGHAVAKALGFNVADPKDKARVSAMISKWIANSVFVVVDGLDEKSNEREFVEIGSPAADTPPRPQASSWSTDDPSEVEF
jgi:hypothetical protein